MVFSFYLLVVIVGGFKRYVIWENTGKIFLVHSRITKIKIFTIWALISHIDGNVSSMNDLGELLYLCTAAVRAEELNI